MTEKPAEVNMAEEHPDYPGLTRKEVADAKERAAKKVAAERKKEALARIEDQEVINLRDAMGETERLQHELENLSPSNREMVSITLSLAPQMADIRIDGTIYRNRGTYNVTRAKAVEMLRIQHLGWEHESVRLGQDKYAFYAQQAQAQRPPLVINARSNMVTSGMAPKGTH